MSEVINAKRRERYRENPAPYIERAAKWAKENPDYVKQHCKNYYIENKERLKEAMRQYRQSPEGKAAHLRAREKSREKNRERSRLWRLNHPGATTIQGRAWKEKNPEKYRLSNANKYANRKQQGEQTWKLSGEELLAFMNEQRGNCLYCKCSLADGFVIEHKVPLSRGGAHVRENVCLACNSCNARKHAKTDVEYMATLYNYKPLDKKE